MGRAPDRKLLNKEDFDSDDRDLVEKIAGLYNTFVEQTAAVLNKSVDFQNLNQEPITLEVSTNASGIPITSTQFKSNLKSRVLGLSVINAINLTNSLNTPTAQPFISYVQNNDLVKVNKVVGLQPNERYRLTVLSIGS